MKTNRSFGFTKRLIGTLAFIALMTVFLVKVFSELALAADTTPSRMPHLEAPAQALGTYQIKDIIEKVEGYPKESLCGNTKDKSDDCGKSFWIVRTPNQLVILEADNGEYKNFYPFKLRSQDCNTLSPKHHGTRGLFEENLCRAVRAKRWDSAKTEVFISYGAASPKPEALLEANMLERIFFLATTMIGHKGYKVVLPKGAATPKAIELIEYTHGKSLYATDYDSVTQYQFVRVGQ